MQGSHADIHKTPVKTNSFLVGVFLLTIANIAVKVIGMFFKIPISHILGDEGMGYFNSAYTIYAWLYMLSTAGFPVAISILVSQSVGKGDWIAARKIKQISLMLLSIVGSLLTVLLIMFDRQIAISIGNENVYWSILFISPSLFLVAISSALRGYYQGLGLMHPTAFSQILEALGKCVIGILFALGAIKKGYTLPVVAGFSISGVTIGSLFSVLYLLLIKPQKMNTCLKTKEIESSNSNWKHALVQLLKIAFPITLSATVMGLINVIDLGLIMRGLQTIGYSPADAAALYGNYSTLVVPMFNLPSVFVYSIAYALVPAITSAIVAHKHDEANRLSSCSLLYTTFISIPCSLGIAGFSKAILSTVFNVASAETAAPYLTAISPGIVFICILSVTNSILQAYGYHMLPIISVLLGGIAKIIFGYFLIRNPNVGMMGAPIGTVVCYIVASVINLIFILKKTDIQFNLGACILKPLWSSFIAIGAAMSFNYLTVGFLQNFMRLLFSVFIAVLIYGCIIIKTKMIILTDVLKIPRLEQYFTRFKKIRSNFGKTNY